MADRKIAYAASASFTLTAASLATDSNLLAGRQSTPISNTSNKYLDFLVGGVITTGSSPTASRPIEVWVFAAWNDTPTYPDVFSTSDANRTVTSRDILFGSCALLASLTADANSNRPYHFKPKSIASLFGGVCPTHFGLWLVHNTAVNLNATGGNHVFSYTPIYETIA